MSRGNARQDVVEDDDDRRRLLNGLDRVSEGCGWEMLAFVVMSNHFVEAGRADPPPSPTNCGGLGTEPPGVRPDDDSRLAKAKV